MSLETGTYIDDLVTSNPTATDPVSQGDDHLRLIKSTIVTTFPNIAGAVTPTHTELNFVDGVTSAIQTQLDTKFDTAGTGLTSSTQTVNVGAGDGISVAADAVALDISGLVAIQGNALNPSQDGMLIDDNGMMSRMSYTDAGIVITEQTGTSYIVAASDINTLIECNNAAAFTLTLNTGIGVEGNWIIVEQTGAGQVTIAGTATVNSPAGLLTYAQYSRLVLICKGAGVWSLGGDSTS